MATYSLCKTHSFDVKPMSANMSLRMLIFQSCTFYLGEGHIFADDAKREEKKKNIEKVENRCHFS